MTVPQRVRHARDKHKHASNKRQRAPRLSVILCTYNRRSYVLATLASLRRQTFAYQNFEVIVVDNGSQDGTLKAVKTFTQIDEATQLSAEERWRVQCFVEPRRGLVHARNAALLAARGEIAVFIDDDTLVDPDMLERLWQAYEETEADAIGMHVAIQWDSQPPHWMIKELFETLGHFSLGPQRMRLNNGEVFASCAFSVKIAVLRAMKFFSPLLSKRATSPAATELANLCWRLRQGGYTLWYEPQALVLQRVTTERLQRAFFVGQAYWQGRGDIMQRYNQTRQEDDKAVWREVWEELKHFTRCLFVQTPLIHVAGRSTAERLLASMDQAQSWGRLIQRLIYLEHIPSEQEIPAIFLVHKSHADASVTLLKHALEKHEVRYLTGSAEIPLGWLWRHRSYRDQPVGILHFYQPGALELTRQQNQQLRFRLWLARCLGVCVVATDDGGWWQSARSPRSHARRAFERKVLHASRAIINSTKRPSLLYRDRLMRRRVRYLLQPGFRGHYPPVLYIEEARERLGLPPSASFVYLCIAHLHTEREIVLLLEAFRLLTRGGRHEESLPNAHLLVVGHPIDSAFSARILRLVASEPQIQMQSTQFSEDDLPAYMGGCNALVLPHHAVHTAGQPQIANLALSHDLPVIAPDLPRFSGILPQKASLPYLPGSRESLAEALVKAQHMSFSLEEAENRALDVNQSWEEYTHDLLKMYRELLGHTNP